MAHVDFGGVIREVCLDYVPEAKVGEYCIIHVGFAISLLSEAEAKETLALLHEIDDIEEELGPTLEPARELADLASVTYKYQLSVEP